jgi:hypothetical protein
MSVYLSIDREPIWAGLFAHFQAALSSQFMSMGRRHIAPPELAYAQQPAFFLVQMKERHEPKPRGVPTRLILQGFIILYVPAPVANENIGEETVLAATQLNAMYKAIDEALLPDDQGTGSFTIGGLVSHCWIDGDTDQDPGISQRAGRGDYSNSYPRAITPARQPSTTNQPPETGAFSRSPRRR